MQQASRSHRILFISFILTLCLAASVTAVSAVYTAGSGTKKAYLADSGSLSAAYDINSDGKADETDVRCLRQHLIGETPAGFNAVAADMDQNGSVNAKDVALLQQHLDSVTQPTTSTTQPTTSTTESTTSTTESTTSTTESTTSTTKTTTRTYDDTSGWSPILP